jgi:hypothetical protein
MVRNLDMLARVLRLIAGAKILGVFGVLAEPWRYLGPLIVEPLPGRSREFLAHLDPETAKIGA